MAKSAPSVDEQVVLSSPPLVEAWFELRWMLEPISPPQIMRDPSFLFALGRFYDAVKDRFPIREDLEASHGPQDMLPHVVRHRFWSDGRSWPALQIGPGVATVNYTKPYKWQLLSADAIYLAEALRNAYDQKLPALELAALRYRNATPFLHSSEDVLDYISKSLNTQTTLPHLIPGPASTKVFPTSMNLILTFDLAHPRGTGKMQLGTATGTPPSLPQGSPSSELFLWELEVASGGADTPSIEVGSQFPGWLESAHEVLHNWFFALIEGELRRSFS